jgi:ribosomal protein L7Ae-like RNA K-turn-binding protein
VLTERVGKGVDGEGAPCAQRIVQRGILAVGINEVTRALEHNQLALVLYDRYDV